MRKVKRKIVHISDLVKCFSLSALAIIFSASSCSAMSVRGLPDWLTPTVERSLKAVWNEIPFDEGIDREGTLELVSQRLFTGYNVKVNPKVDEPEVIFQSEKNIFKPEVRIVKPDLRGDALNWFNEDVKGLAEDVSVIAMEVPQVALTWSDVALRERLSEMIRERLPGWEFTQQVYISSTGTVINLSFRPSTDMILAVKPILSSRTIPVMFRSDLEVRLQPELSPLIGIPIEWGNKHESDIAELAREYLAARNTVGNMRAEVTVKFTSGKIAEIDARVDSRTLMFSVWVAAYAGIEGRYPEAGAFLGFRPIWRIGEVNLAPEVYGEVIFALEDFGVSYRVGGRFELLASLWGGLEYVLPEGKTFMRVEYIPLKVRRPYARWRWELGVSNHELGLGYRFDEHVSAEIYYDGSIGLRGIWNL